MLAIGWSIRPYACYWLKHKDVCLLLVKTKEYMFAIGWAMGQIEQKQQHWVTLKTADSWGMTLPIYSVIYV